MYIVNVEGAVEKDGNWLLIRRSQDEDHAGGTISLVGGTCDLEGHSSDILERTLQREMFEEVGIEVTNLRYVNSSSFVTDSGEHVIDIVFLCDLASGVAYTKSPTEVEEVLWMTFEEILNHPEIPDYLKNNMKLAKNLQEKAGS